MVAPAPPGTGFTGAAVLATVSSTGTTLLASQTVWLTSNNWNWTSKYMGLQGNVTFSLTAARSVTLTVKYSKNGGIESTLYGATYYDGDNTNFTLPVSGVTWNGTTGDTFSAGDNIKFNVYIQLLSGANTTIATATPFFPAVVSAIATA